MTSGETVAVLGAAGGLGSAIVQLCVAQGARVIAVVGGEDKVAFCRQLGAEAVDHSAGDFVIAVRALTDGRGARSPRVAQGTGTTSAGSAPASSAVRRAKSAHESAPALARCHSPASPSMSRSSAGANRCCRDLLLIDRTVLTAGHRAGAR